MSKIQILSEQLRNQIAAGEVVERPASVVKELVENSIDADSSQITVEIEAGGTELIRVTDNGKGMNEEDAKLAFERHATSKISKEEDLHMIATMGFRGEALASIASVGQCVLKTKLRGEIEGTEIVCHGSKMISVQPVGCPEGTQIEIKNLFFNTPARKKYLKTKGAEYRQILEVMMQIAMVNSETGFRVVKDGKAVLDVPQNQSLADRVRAILGKSVADEMIEVFYGGADIQVKGLIGKPSVARASRKAQYLFVNDRAISDSSISYVTRDAYGTLLMDGKKPMFVLQIEIDPKLVDVNVHPRKSEVRFVDKREVCSVARRACKAALERIYGEGAGRRKTKESVVENGSTSQWGQNLARGGVDQNASTESLRGDGVNYSSTESLKGSDVNYSSTPNGGFYNGNKQDDQVQGAIEFGQQFGLGGVKEKKSLSELNADRNLSTEMSGMSGESSGNSNGGAQIEGVNSQSRVAGGIYSPALSMKPIAQISNSYIVAQNAEGLVLIDQHAAHERVLFEKFKQAWEKRPLKKQNLLIPMQIELSHQEVALLEESQEVFEKLGFEINEFGGNTFSISAVPSDLGRANIQKILMGILDDLLNERKLKSAEERKIKILEYMACRTAIKFGDELTMEEMVGLIKEMDITDGIATCPHGRPTMIPLTFHDLEKQFGRKG